MATGETPDSVLADLDALVGLMPVKVAIHRIADIHRLNARRAAAGEPVVRQPLDLVFAGEPGTGEDDVARIVARLYVALELLPEVKVAEVGRAHLVAVDEAATHAQVAEAVRAADGGILFVDDAQQLISQQPGDQGDTAIRALVAAMEQSGRRFAVILSGPTEPMRLIAEHHPALRAAFEDVIEFPRYTPEELVLLFDREAAALRIDVPEAVRAAVFAHLIEVHEAGRFRSARYVPGLVEEMYARLAARTLDDADQDAHRRFAVQDVPPVDQAGLDRSGLRVGFSAR
jgi:SpoVK/Ycf46/Vps4 family AAA+-type ATPase